MCNFFCLVSMIQILVLSSSRELATQTEKTIQSIGVHTNIRAQACIGGKSIAEDIKKLERGVHDVSGTPGRIYEMIKRASLQTKSVKILILDRVMKVRCWAKVSKTTFTRLTDTMFMFALFLATFPQEILKMINKFMMGSWENTCEAWWVDSCSECFLWLTLNFNHETTKF